jgi:hypothetical protein
MHRNHPQGIRNGIWKSLCFPQHNTIVSNGQFSALLTQPSERSIRSNRSSRL